MGRKITPVERIKSKAVRVALNVFLADPSLGKCQAKALFSEIYSHLKSGMEEEAVVQAVVKGHATNSPPGQLLLM